MFETTNWAQVAFGVLAVAGAIGSATGWSTASSEATNALQAQQRFERQRIAVDRVVESGLCLTTEQLVAVCEVRCAD